LPVFAINSANGAGYFFTAGARWVKMPAHFVCGFQVLVKATPSERRLEPNDIKAHQRPVNKWRLPNSALQPQGALTAQTAVTRPTTTAINFI
jgi:hypothetical protein